MKLRFEVIPTSGMWLTMKERVMERRTFLMLAAGALLTGCAKPKPAPKKAGAEKKDVTLCGKCGQVKGSDVCCKPGAEKCAKCGLAKDSPGCCRIKKGDDVTLCIKCGQVKGSELCCKADAEKCAKCGLAKDSPGCCRINKL